MILETVIRHTSYGSYVTVIMASAKAFQLMESGKWDAVREMLSAGQLSIADLEEQHGVRLILYPL